MVQTLNCPSCGAPLDYPAHGEPAVRCSFCGNTVVLPQELRSPQPSRSSGMEIAGINVGAIQQVLAQLQAGRKIEAIKIFREAFGVGLKKDKDAVEALERNEPISLSAGQIRVGRSSAQVAATGLDDAAMAEVLAQLQAGRKIEAIKTFRMATGLGLKESKDAVEALERGQPLPLAVGQDGYSPAPAQATTGRSVGCWIVSLLVIVLIAAAVVIPFYFIGSVSEQVEGPLLEAIGQVLTPTPQATATLSPTPTPGYADLVLQFGTEGINPGQFTDARRVAVDGAGYIYVAEWQGGRIQRFDPEGNFVSFWSVDPKRAVTGLAADRQGVVYVTQNIDLGRYNGATGELLGTLPRPDSGGSYDIITVTPDGGLLVSTGAELLRFDANLNRLDSFNAGNLRELELNTTFPPDAEGLAVDGLGNVYALDETNGIVIKFGPDGRYLDQFALNEGGSTDAIAVDGQGRLYIGASSRIDVYDLEGRYLDKIDFEGLAFGLTVNDRDELFVASRTEVLKFAPARSVGR